MQRFFSFLSKLANKNQLRKEKFNSLPYKNKLYYLKDNFQILGIGSSRITFLINSGKVIKLAKNNAGKAQNKVEFDTLLKLKSKFIPKAFDKSPDSIWIEMEFVLPINSLKQFANYFNLSEYTIAYFFSLNVKSFDQISKIKNNLINQNNLLKNDEIFDHSKKIKLNEKYIKDLDLIFNNSKFVELYSFIFDNLKSSIGDLTDISNISNFGISNDQIKIIDLGFDEFVSDIFYPLNDFNDPDQFSDPELFINDQQRPFQEYSSPDPHNKLPSISKIDLKRKEPKQFNDEVTFKP